MAQGSARSRTQVSLLLVILNTLVLLVAFTVVVDLRRLQTPQGVALRWFQAAVFGDCGDYLHFSVRDPARSDSRTHQQLCSDLRRASAAARGDSLNIGFRLGEIDGDQVHLVFTRQGVTKDVVVHLGRLSGHWKVIRDAVTCGSVGCA